MLQTYVFFFWWRGIPKIQNFPNFKFFPILGSKGGYKISNYSQIQKSPKQTEAGGRGQENYGLFPFFGTFLNSEALLNLLDPFFSLNFFWLKKSKVQNLWCPKKVQCYRIWDARRYGSQIKRKEINEKIFLKTFCWKNFVHKNISVWKIFVVQKILGIKSVRSK